MVGFFEANRQELLLFNKIPLRENHIGTPWGLFRGASPVSSYFVGVTETF